MAFGPAGGSKNAADSIGPVSDVRRSGAAQILKFFNFRVGANHEYWPQISLVAKKKHRPTFLRHAAKVRAGSGQIKVTAEQYVDESEIVCGVSR